MKKRVCVILLVLSIAFAGVYPAFADGEASDIASSFQLFLTLSGKKSTRSEIEQVHFSAMDFDAEVVQVDYVTAEGIQIPIKYHFFDYGTGDTAFHFAEVKAVIPESVVSLTDDNIAYLLFGDNTLTEYSNLGKFYLVQNESGNFNVVMRYALSLHPNSAAKICWGALGLLEKDVDIAVENLKTINSSGR